MTKEEKLELIKKADTQLDGFENYIQQLGLQRGVPFIEMCNAYTHISDLRRDLEIMAEEIDADPETE